MSTATALAFDDSPKMTIREFWAKVYFPLRLVDASKSAIQQMDVAINRFEAYLGRVAQLSDLTESTFAAWLADGLTKGLSPVTCNMRAKHLATIWRLARKKRFALNLDVPDDLDGLSYLKVPTHQPQAWLPEEMDRLLESCQKAHGRISGVKASSYWVALLLVLYDTGLRLAAALETRFDEIDLTSKMLRVPADRMKNNCEQYFRLTDQTLIAISEASTPPREKLFPWPWQHHRALYDRWRVILKRAGLPASRRDLFHKIRRTTASNLAMVGGEWQAIQQLGHRNEATIKRYIDPRFTANHDGARLLARPGVAPGQPAPQLPDTLVPQSDEEKGISPRMIANVEKPGASLLDALAKKQYLTGDDLKRALKAIEMPPVAFAIEAKLDPVNLKKVLSSGKRLTPRMEKRVRIVLGISDRRAGM